MLRINDSCPLIWNREPISLSDTIRCVETVHDTTQLQVFRIGLTSRCILSSNTIGFFWIRFYNIEVYTDISTSGTIIDKTLV